MASRDIRSFFTQVASKSNKNSKNENNAAKPIASETSKPEKSAKKTSKRNSEQNSDELIGGRSNKKQRTTGIEKCKSPSSSLKAKVSSSKSLIEVDSSGDDCDIVVATPEKPSELKKRKKRVLSSDSENEESRPKQSKQFKGKEKTPEKLKPINIKEVFSSTVKQSKVVTPKIADNTSKVEKKVVSKKTKNTEIGIHDDKDFEKTLADLDDGDDIFLQNEDILDKTIESIIEKGSSKKEDSKKDTPKSTKKTKFEHTDSGIDDQGRYEKKRYCALQFQQYKNRSGPKNHGSKELPKGKPNCLSTLCFLRTGVLDSLETEEFEILIKEHGGRVVQAVSKKVNYVVAGEDAGPSKLSKAENYGIPVINEDTLLDMILEKSGLPKKYSISTVSSFEDAGINDSFVSNESGETLYEKKKENKTKASSDEEVARTVETKKKKNSPVKKSDDVSSKKTQVKPEHHVLKKNDKVIKCEDTDLKKEISEKKSEIGSENDAESLSLSEKYKPTDLKQIVGQQMDSSNMNKLRKWLAGWHNNEKLRKQKRISQPKPWDKNNDGSYYKCALLSGSPGVGKTTTATLVCQSLGYDIVEFNASDTRSKKLLQQEVATALNTLNISSFNVNNTGLDKKRVILMDEVDGMAGNEDRGGMQELITLIKISKIPIICMCNDRNHQKMRTLANYCFDLRFEKPKPQQILGFVMSICCKEGIKVSPQVATEIINGTTCDIRQTLNQLSMLANLDSGISLEQARKDAAAAKKDTVLGPWQVCKMVFTEAEQKNMSLIDKSRLFFYDYSMGPLFVQENYLKVQPRVERKNLLKHVAAAAEAISMGATIDKKIRESNNWSLLDMQAMYSSVLPGYYMSGHFTAAIDFPGWLGKNSKRNKLKRFNTELAIHTKIQTSGGALAMTLDYSKALLRSITTPLKKKGLNGVSDAVEVMKSYQLLREDLDSLVELCTIPKQKSLMDGIDSKVKSAFTRLYNKEVPVFSYSAVTGVSKKKSATLYNDEYNEDDNEESETEDTIENDTLIKSKTKTKTSNKETAKPSTSKQNAKSKGKGKK